MAVARLGYEIDSSGAVKAAGDLDKMTAAAVKAEMGAESIGKASKEFGGYVRGAGAQTAYFTSQLNDIGMMMAAGQNPFQLALQQGSQVSEGFQRMGLSGRNAAKMLATSFASMVNPMSLVTIGVIAGTAALSQWAVAAIGASDDAETLEDQLSDLTGAISDYRKAAVTGADASDYIRDQFGRVTAQTIELAERMQELRIREIMLDAADATSGLAGAFSGGLRSELARLEDLLGSDWWDDNSDGAKRLASSLDEVRMAKGPEEQLEAVRALGKQFLAATGGVKGMTDEQRAFYSEVLKTEGVLNQVVSLTSDASDEAGRLSGNISDAAGNAVRLRNALSDVASASLSRSDQISVLNAQIRAAETGASTAAAKASTETALALGRAGATVDQIAAAVSKAGAEASTIEALRSRLGELRKDDTSRAGGGRRVDEFARDLEQLRESLRTESEVIDEWYLEQQSLLNDRRSQEILGIEGHNEAKIRLEREYQEKLDGIRQMGNQWGVESALSGGAEILGAMGAFNNKALKMQAIFAAGSALISTYQGAAKELEKGTFGFASAAAVIAKGISFVAAIKSAGAGGSGGGGGGTSSGITAATSEPPRRVTEAIIQVQGGGRLSVEELNQITKGLRDRSKDGDVIIAGFVAA